MIKKVAKSEARNKKNETISNDQNQNDPNRIPTIGMLSHWIRIAKKTDFERIKLNYGI